MRFKIGTCLTSSRIWAMIIGLFEMLLSTIGLVLFSLVHFNSEKYSCWLPLPNEMLDNQILIKVVANSLLMLCLLQLFMGLMLFEGARMMNRGRVRFWLIGIFYLTIICTIVIVGIETAEIKDTKFNAIAFLNIAIRFSEIILIYVFLQEMKSTHKKTKSSTTSSNSTKMFFELKPATTKDKDSRKLLENSELSLISCS